MQKKATPALLRYPLEVARNLKQEVRRLLRHRAAVRTMPKAGAAPACGELRAASFDENSGASRGSSG